ncbi:acyl-CoA dehydrogenase family protein [Kangiella sediminilitoris]|uniref:FadE8 n=1 Tax=Kangiella sediminilitoris TaxID=1144748 RepID=A0A1B3BBA1_9GAMM|nr:acyl-CoA dehydrogenase family protein [Kangiella sediminilitoris]AOE50036.1 FadE8 [Kangiella sediminilitoris]
MSEFNSLDDIVKKAKDVAETHQVTNQPPMLENYNIFESDMALLELLNNLRADWGHKEVSKLGEVLGQSQWINKGFQANQNPPKLHTHDRFGNRLDLIEYHPAYHELMDLAIEHKIPVLPWVNQREGSHLVRMAKNYLYNQIEAGSACPLTMTFSAVPPLRKSPHIGSQWLDKLLNGRYDPANKPIEQKTGVTIGMAMTEKQGGTDVRANKSYAALLSKKDKTYELIGHKWFCSAPMCDGFLTLAQTVQGLSCFLVPRWRPDGNKNQIYIQRLKDKMGNRSNASSEIEFRGAFGWLLGSEGKGVKTIIEMVALTRYDCMIGSSALMRQAVAQITHHCHYREVFNKPLDQHPLMQNVLADLCLESEAALAMTARMAKALDNPDDKFEQNLLRLTTAIGKYWICKRASSHIGEAQECLGGIGYVEESILPRLYREAPVNSIWEGSGNVQCLDVIRAINKSPETLDSYLQELSKAKGKNNDYDHLFKRTVKQLEDTPSDAFEFQSRYFVERLAKLMQACQLLLNGNPKIADSFCLSRLSEIRGLNYGNLPPSVDCKFIIDRARPKLN